MKSPKQRNKSYNDEKASKFTWSGKQSRKTHARAELPQVKSFTDGFRTTNHDAHGGSRTCTRMKSQKQRSKSQTKRKAKKQVPKRPDSRVRGRSSWCRGFTEVRTTKDHISCRNGNHRSRRPSGPLRTETAPPILVNSNGIDPNRNRTKVGNR